jgi:hypothetical protein
MEFHKEFGGASKGGGGAWTHPMHPLYIPSTTKNPLSKPSQIPPPTLAISPGPASLGPSYHLRPRGGHYPLFSWITCVKWVFKGGVLYLIQVLNNTVYYLIFQFLQFYVGLCLVLFFIFYFLLCILLVIFWLNWEYNFIFIISFFMWGKLLGPVVPNSGS